MKGAEECVRGLCLDSHDLWHRSDVAELHQISKSLVNARQNAAITNRDKDHIGSPAQLPKQFKGNTLLALDSQRVVSCIPIHAAFLPGILKR